MRGIAEDIYIVIHSAYCYCEKLQKLHFVGICSLARKSLLVIHPCCFITKAIPTICEVKHVKA